MKYMIVSSLVSKVSDKINQYKNKFKKYGKTPQVIISDEYFDATTQRFVCDVEITGAEYKFGDYSFIASLEWSDDVQANIIKGVSDVTIPQEYIHSRKCDHCKTNRERKRTILLQNNVTKEFCQVGNQCVKDYIGVDVNNYLAYLSCFESLEHFLESTNNEQTTQKDDLGFTPDEILLQTIEDVKENGYISNASIEKWCEENDYAEYCPLEKTSSRVFKIMNYAQNLDGTLQIPHHEITSDSINMLKVLKEFVNELEVPDTTDMSYISNIKLLFNMKYIKNSDLGLLVSSYGYYLRKQAEKTQQKMFEKSTFVGEIGKRIEFNSVPEVITSIESDYGRSYLYRFIVNNNILTWWTTKVLKCDTSYKIKATVKNHEKYKGVLQTAITRGTVIE